MLGKQSANSFESWKSIGAALAVGKAHALRVTGANAAWGRNYCHVFGEWIKQHHFDRMAKSVRSVAIELHENVHGVETNTQREAAAGLGSSIERDAQMEGFARARPSQMPTRPEAGSRSRLAAICFVRGRVASRSGRAILARRTGAGGCGLALGI